MTKPVDLSRFHAFLDPRLTADAMIQGTLDEQLRQIQAIIAEAHKNQSSEITIDAVGMDRAILSKVLTTTSSYVDFVENKGTELVIRLKPLQNDAGKEIANNAHAYLDERTIAVWPLTSPDESDPLAQGRHLRVLEKLLGEVWKAAQEKKQSFLFQALGYDRRLLARAVLLILPPNSVSFEKVTEATIPGFIRIAIHSAAQMENFNSIIPFVQPSSRLEDPNAEVAFRRSRYTSSNLQLSPEVPESSSPKINPEILQFIEAYIHSWQDKETLSNLVENYNTDPLLLQHFRLGLEGIKNSSGNAEAIQKIINRLKTVDGTLSSIEGCDAACKEIVAGAVGADLIHSFLRALKTVKLQPAQKSASHRQEIESLCFRIPNKFFEDRPPLAAIEIEQVDRSYWPFAGSQPLAQLIVDDTPITSRPILATMESHQRRILYYQNLLTKLARSSSDFGSLLKSLGDLKQRDLSSQETKLLALLRAGSFSAFGHADHFLRTHILIELFSKEYTIRSLSNTVANIITFSTSGPDYLVTRKALYSLMGPKKLRSATFIMQSVILVKPDSRSEITISLPFFDAEGQQTFEERLKLYELIKKLLPR